MQHNPNPDLNATSKWQINAATNPATWSSVSWSCSSSSSHCGCGSGGGR